MRTMIRFSLAALAAPLVVASAANGGPVAIGDVFPDVPLCATRRADAPPWPVVPRRVPGPSFPVVVPDGDRDLRIMAWGGLLADPVTPDIPFVVRAGTVGITIRAEAPDSPLLVSVELLSPDSTLIACSDCPDAPAVGEERTGRGTTQMPSTDRPGWELGTGEYAFRVRVRTPPGQAVDRVVDQAVVNVVATFRTDDAITVEHVLDLNFVYLPGSTLSEQIATTDPHFAALLDTINAYLAPTGIRVGKVTHVDLAKPEFSVIATWEEAGEMFRTSRRFGQARALNVYCIEKFVAPLNPVVGLSGGIPGPLLNGTPDSGIAVRMSAFFSCPDCLPAYGSLFAHEIGHYLGFYHTSEGNQEAWDPFSDTPECRDLPDLHTCPDWDYVMFPVIHPANLVWSPGQVAVAGTHPLVRTIPVVGGQLAAATAPLAPALTLSPNPFRDAVRVEWAAPVGGARPQIRVHDVSGRLVRTLAGSSGISWDGRDGAGRRVAPGTYFVRVRSGADERTGRVVRLP